MTQSEQVMSVGAQSRRPRGTLRPVTLRGQPAWGDVAAQASSEPADGAASGSAPARPATDTGAVAVNDLEAEVYAARDLHGDDRTKVRRMFARARSRMSEATYRRALVLARDTGVLSIEECISGAVAMEWEPLPRPEFSLATIEAAVAEQERSGGAVEPAEGATS
jgi:hypothetical protein